MPNVKKQRQKMDRFENLDYVIISAQAHKTLQLILAENPKLTEIINNSEDTDIFIKNINAWVLNFLKDKPHVIKYYKREETGRAAYEKLTRCDIAAIRLLDYCDYAGTIYTDLNYHGERIKSNPLRFLWLAATKGKGGAENDFFIDMLYLFRQFSGTMKKPNLTKEDILEYMDKHPSGLDKNMIEIREENKKRIINIFIQKIDSGEIKHSRYHFEPEDSQEDKFAKALEWWNDKNFHLKFAIRTPQLLNEFLGLSLTFETMRTLKKAQEEGIPFFVNPYYLSLLNTKEPDFAVGSDLAIRDYIIYTKELINEYGEIIAWEKEDIVEHGKPNAAGWYLPPYKNIHRRYPEVAILIPDTAGRACGGLCASCQRMYDFQTGHLNFNLDKLLPKETWKDKLRKLLSYYENDTQLRDILITGGDALMSSDKSLKHIFEEVTLMAQRKKDANKNRKEGEKYAEIVRVRLGTRLPVYLPQRITENLTTILKEFKDKAGAIGIKQFVIQTHFESAMEVTPEAKAGLEKLINAGWIVTNQLVFTAAASRRGHTAKLRKVLNDCGVLTYYTFTTKGYMENSANFATNARAVQEQFEEKAIGKIPKEAYNEIKKLPENPENIVENLNKLKEKYNIPFVATDRNVINLPGVGKSLTYRTIGLTRYGRRILEFDHDSTRKHSPIIHDIGRINIIESKSMNDYLKQLEEMGENPEDYESIFGYSIGETEPLMPIFKYPEYSYKVTQEMTNI